MVLILNDQELESAVNATERTMSSDPPQAMVPKALGNNIPFFPTFPKQDYSILCGCYPPSSGSDGTCFLPPQGQFLGDL